MSYAYNIKKRFSSKKPYRYWLEDSCYKSDSVMQKDGKNVGGRKFKIFYDELSKHIFDINLEILEQIGDFPIAYNERSNSAAIAMALSRLTPYVISEYGIDCRGVELQSLQDIENLCNESGENKESGSKSGGKNANKNASKSRGKARHRRTIDFWCATHSDLHKGLDVWIESKHLWLNVGKSAKKEFDSGFKRKIREAFAQIAQIGQLAKQDRTTDGVKVALFSIGAYCGRKQCVEDLSELDSIPSKVAAALEAQARKYFMQDSANPQNLGTQNLGVLVGALDLRPSIRTDKEDAYHIYGGGYLPFILLGAVVLP